MATTCKAKVDIGPNWKKGVERTIPDGQARALKNSGWVEFDEPDNKKKEG